MTTQARDFYDSEEEFQTVLDAAEENARTDEEIKFVDDILTKVGKYGGGTFLSDAQNEWLKKIAGR